MVRLLIKSMAELLSGHNVSVRTLGQVSVRGHMDNDSTRCDSTASFVAGDDMWPNWNRPESFFEYLSPSPPNRVLIQPYNRYAVKYINLCINPEVRTSIA